MRPIPLSVSDFRSLRERGLEYVDKSHLVREVLDKGAEALLLPRPRRFGKTLNLSMLRYFFEKRGEDLSGLFEGLSIWRAGEPYRAHFQRYPVIFLSFKGTKHDRFEDTWASLAKLIEVLFREHADVLASGLLTEGEASDYQAILDGTAGRALYERAVLDLSVYLHRVHGEKVVLLIDEYDEPIHAGYLCGYAKEALGFVRPFLSAALKDNPHLFKAVLTGILRVAKESIFSGLNNVIAYSLLARDFSTCFGFTEPEVEALLDDAGRRDELPVVRSFYNGYVFGGTAIYNPWSILNFLDREGVRPSGYWLGTSSNDLIRETLRRHADEAQVEIEALLEGGGVERRLDENVALGDLMTRPAAMWSLLTFSGYLKAEEVPGPRDEEPRYRLSIPNREVREVYASTFREWMEERLDGGESGVARLTRALLSGDAETLEIELQAFTERVLSYHDTALRPEQVYHAFVIGLLATMEPEHEVRSNRESGRGRPDVMIRPRQPGEPGAVLELKVARPGKKTPEQALDEGLAQIRERGYAAELRAAGASPAHAFAVAFDGKTVRVKAAEG